jgi:cell wall-associated NlpC family hydrolase
VLSALRIRTPADVKTFEDHAKVGDIVLFRGTPVTIKDDAMRRYQEGCGHSSEASAFNHAAIYVGNETIYHSVPHGKNMNSITSGVKPDRIGLYARGADICLLRWTGMTPQVQRDIEANCQALDGRTYTWPAPSCDTRN